MVKWAQKDDDDVKFEMPEDKFFALLNCPSLFIEDEVDDNDFFRTKDNKDLIHFVTKDAHNNDFSPEYMAKLRQDSHFIASKPSLHNTITNGMDGIIDESAYESRLLLATYLQEANVVFKILNVNNLESQETLFTSYKELKEAAQKFKISDFYKKKMPYLREIQGRSKSISLIKRILNGEKVDDVEVDYERRSDTLFTKLHNSIESLVMIDGLVFKAKMPVKGESHQFCLVLENSDAERRMASLHAKQHRAHVYLYTLFCKDFWTPSAFRLAYNVTSRCPNCAQMKARKKNKCALPNLTSDLMNKWAVDYKGPIMHGNSKYYILACVELNLRLVHFSIAKSLEATETAKLLFEGIIASYGSSIEIISDRGKSFLN